MSTLHLHCKNMEDLYESENGFITGWWPTTCTIVAARSTKIALHREPDQPPFLVGKVTQILPQGMTSAFLCRKLPVDEVKEKPTQWLYGFAVTLR